MTDRIIEAAAAPTSPPSPLAQTRVEAPLSDASASTPKAMAHAGALTHTGAMARVGAVARGDEGERDAHVKGVTFRVVLVSLLIALFFAYTIPVIDYRFFNTFLGATHLPPGAIGALLLLMLVVNPVLRLISERLKFSRNEVLTVYLSCLFSTLVVGIGGNNYFVSFIIGSFYYSTQENRWFDVLKGLPPWFTPALNPDGSYNRYIVESWYSGLRAGSSIPWGAWIVPLLAWGLFLGASFWMMGCLSVILRAQWGEREALSFPLLRLPLQLTEDVNRTDSYGIIGGFFRNPLMWVGFGIAAVIQLINGLNLYFPEVPSIPLSLNTAPFLSEPPWNQIGGISVVIYPIAVGVAYLLTSEVAFSLWFCFLLFKLQLVGAYFVGYIPNTLPAAPETSDRVFLGYQEVGAYLAYTALIFWTGRSHFGHVLQRAMGRAQPTPAESREALSYPIAFWGLVGGFALMTAWGVAAGISLPLSLVLWASYLVIAIVLSRVVAEGGLLFVHHNWMPLGALSGLLGMGAGTFLSPAHGIGAAAFMEAATIQDYRGSLMPSFVQSFKLAHDRGIAARPLFALIGTVIVLGMVVGFTMNVRLGYENNGLGLQTWLSLWGPRVAGGNAYNMSTTQRAGDPVAWGWMVAGGFVTWGMMAMRSRFAWFPLHPIGYLMGLNYPAHAFWFSIFLGWTCKTLISRYGGLESARKLQPAFLGLVMGDVSMMLFWIIIDGWQGHTGHQLMPG